MHSATAILDGLVIQDSCIQITEVDEIGFANLNLSSI